MLAAFPAALSSRYFFVLILDRIQKLLLHFRLLRLRQLQERHGIAFVAVKPLFRDAVEKRSETVEVFLQEWVVLVIVAALAAKRDAEPRCRSRLDAIDDVLVLILLRNCAPLEINHVVPIEAS